MLCLLNLGPADLSTRVMDNFITIHFPSRHADPIWCTHAAKAHECRTESGFEIVGFMSKQSRTSSCVDKCQKTLDGAITEWQYLVSGMRMKLQSCNVILRSTLHSCQRCHETFQQLLKFCRSILIIIACINLRSQSPRLSRGQYYKLQGW